MKLGLKSKFLFVFSLILSFAIVNMIKEPANAHNLKPSSYISCVNNAVAPLDNLKDIQTFLNCNGFNPGPIDGLAGSRTTNAVISFQKTVGLTADGVVGPATKQAMRGYSSVSFTFTGSGWGHGVGLSQYLSLIHI